MAINLSRSAPLTGGGTVSGDLTVTGDMEMREFFMREFKRQLEKGVSALKRGPYMIQGFKEMRN